MARFLIHPFSPPAPGSRLMLPARLSFFFRINGVAISSPNDIPGFAFLPCRMALKTQKPRSPREGRWTWNMNAHKLRLCAFIFHVQRPSRGDRGFCVFNAMRQGRKANPGMSLGEEIATPLILKKNDSLAGSISREPGAGGENGWIKNRAILESGPTNYFPGRTFEPRFGAVLGLHSILDHLE